MNRRAVAIIQARMGSTRLPGKVLLELGGRTVLANVVARARAARLISEVVVATTTLPDDDVVALAAASAGVRSFRGSEHDVLARYLECARQSTADVIVRITADCPLLDPDVLDAVVDRYLSSAPACDYASNTIVRTFPRGLDVEAFSREALETAAGESNNADEREHVTLFFHRGGDRFRLCSVVGEQDLSRHRWTLDTSDDLRFLRTVFDALEINASATPSYQGVVEFLDANPRVFAINADTRQKPVRQHPPSI